MRRNLMTQLPHKGLIQNLLLHKHGCQDNFSKKAPHGMGCIYKCNFYMITKAKQRIPSKSFYKGKPEIPNSLSPMSKKLEEE